MPTASKEVTPQGIPAEAEIMRISVPIRFKKIVLDLAIECDKQGWEYHLSHSDGRIVENREYCFRFLAGAEAARQLLGTEDIFEGHDVRTFITTDEPTPYVFTYVNII